MGDKPTRGLPARRVEKRLIKMVVRPSGATARTPSASAVRVPMRSKRSLGGVLSSHVLTTPSIILQRVLPVSRSTIANGSGLEFVMGTAVLAVPAWC